MNPDRWTYMHDSPVSAQFWRRLNAALVIGLLVLLGLILFNLYAHRLYDGSLYVSIPDAGRYPVAGCEQWPAGTSLSIVVWRERDGIKAGCRTYQDTQR